MKRIAKLLTATMMAVIMLCFAFSGTVASFRAVFADAGAIKGATIVVSKIPTKGEVGEEIIIPKGESPLSGEIVVNVKVTNPRGQVLVANDDTFVLQGDGSYKLYPMYIGEYKVQYEVDEATIPAGFVDDYFATKSQVYTITVSGTEPTMYFAKNNETIMPTVIDKADEVVLPKPVITKSNGTTLENFVMLRTGKDVNDATTNPSGYEVVWVSASGPDYSAVELKKDGSKISFVANQEENIYGTYTITFSYSENSLKVKKTVKVDVEKDYKTNYVDNIKLNYTFDFEIDKSACVGKEVKLPYVDVKNENDDNKSVASYTKVKVDYVNGEEVKPCTVEFKQIDNSYYFVFTPEYLTTNGSYYRIEYTMTDFYGNTIGPVRKIIDNVEDTENPNVYVVKEYEVDSLSDIDLTDMSYMIPNKMVVAASNGLVLPAIYATDNYLEYEGMTLERVFINGSKSVRIDEKEDTVYLTNKYIKLDSDYFTKYAENEDIQKVKDWLNTAGNYTVKYQVKVNNVVKSYVSFEIIVLDTYIDELAPRITMPTIDSVVYNGEAITFEAPKVFDYVSESLSEVNVNTKNCLVEVGYYDGDDFDSFLVKFNKGEFVDESDDYHVISKLDGKEYYSFETNGISNENIYVLVRATDNAKYGSLNDGIDPTVAINNVAVKYSKVKIVANIIDEDAPEFDEAQLHLIEADQTDEKVELGEFVFTDANAEYVKVNVNVYNPKDALVSVKGLTRNWSDSDTDSVIDTITIDNAWFAPTFYGYYTVVMTATDLAGNSRIVSFKVKVNDTEDPVIEVNFPSIMNVEVNETITLPKCVVKDNGEVIENYEITEIVFVGDNPEMDFVLGLNKFTAKDAGTYTFKYVASDGNGHTVESGIKKIVASDTIKPVFNEIDWPIQVKLEDKVAIPYIGSTDSNGIKEFSVTVKSPNGETINTFTGFDNVKYDGDSKGLGYDMYYEFEPTSKDGKYTIIYKTTDNFDNSTELEKVLSVGDVVPPTIEILDNAALPTNANLNGSISISKDCFKLTDGTTVFSVSDSKFVVSMKDTEGESTTLNLSDGSYNYTFNKAGTYTLTYTLTDNAGNKTTKVSKIVVTGENAKVNELGFVWGTVLIVAAVALLAGVVVYFVITNKKAKVSAKKESEEK